MRLSNIEFDDEQDLTTSQLPFGKQIGCDPAMKKGMDDMQITGVAIAFRQTNWMRLTEIPTFGARVDAVAIAFQQIN